MRRGGKGEKGRMRRAGLAEQRSPVAGEEMRRQDENSRASEEEGEERGGWRGEERRAERGWLRTGVGRAGRSSDRPAAAAPPAGPRPAAADPAPHARPRPGASSRTRSFQLTGRETRLQSSVTAAPALPCPPPAQAYVRACARPPLSTPLDVDPPRPAQLRLRGLWEDRDGRGSGDARP